MENTEQPQGRINPTNSAPKNPAKYFAEWKSDKECFSYYDKEQKDSPNKGNVLIPLPFIFLPLEKCICLKGYNEDEKVSYISNEVKDIKKQEFIVNRYDSTKKPKLAFKGLYDDIKEKAAAVDAKWTESLYAAVKNAEGKLEIVNIQLRGAGITNWIDFVKSNDIWSNAITVKSFSNHKKGKNNYVAPVFTLTKIKKETDIEAAVLQKQVLEFLSNKFASTQEAAETNDSGKPKGDEPKQVHTAGPVTTIEKEEPLFTGSDDDDMDLPF